MALDQDIALLSHVGLFQGFTPEQLRLIAFGAERERFDAGTVIYREKEAAGGGYVVVSGQIDLVIQKGRRDILLDSCRRGGLVGEIALITATRRATDAVAHSDSEALYISRTLFHRMLSEYPETAAFLQGRIAQSVRKLMAQLDEVHARLGHIGQLSDLKSLADSEAAEAGDDGDKEPLS